MDKLSKSKYLLYISSVLQFQGFIGPVLYVFYTRYMGLDTSQYLFCDSLLFFVMAVVEIPSGMIADYFGRKRVLVISKVAVILGMTTLLLLNTFQGAIIVAIVYGLFGALESGIEDSIIYELFESNEKLNDYESITAKSNGIGFAASILYSISAGYLIEYDLALPVVLDIVVCVLTLIAVILLLDNGGVISNNKGHIIIPDRAQLKNVLPIIFFSGILTCTVRTMYSFYQPVLTGMDVQVLWFGYAAAVYNVISALATTMYTKIRKGIGKWQFMVLLLIIQFLCTFGISLSKSLVVFLFILSQQIQRGIMGPFLHMQVNSYIDTSCGNRVTLMSVYFFVITMFSSVSLWMTSFLTEQHGIKVSMLVYSVLVNSIGAIMLLLLRYKTKRGTLHTYDT